MCQDARTWSRSGSWSYAHSPPEVTRSPHELLHNTHCCTPPQTTIPITHCTDDTQLIALNTLLITLTHTADCTDHTAYLSHGLPLCHYRVLLSIWHPPDVSHIPSLSVFCYSFCLVLLCCLVVWFLTFCLLPGSSPCLALWILFADRRPRPFTWLLSCLALYMPVCHLLDPACVLTMSSNKSLHMDLHASRLVGPVTENSATRGSSGFSNGPWSGTDPCTQLFDLRQGSRSIEEYVTQFFFLICVTYIGRNSTLQVTRRGGQLKNQQPSKAPPPPQRKSARFLPIMEQRNGPRTFPKDIRSFHDFQSIHKEIYGY